MPFPEYRGQAEVYGVPEGGTMGLAADRQVFLPQPDRGLTKSVTITVTAEGSYETFWTKPTGPYTMAHIVCIGGGGGGGSGGKGANSTNKTGGGGGGGGAYCEAWIPLSCMYDREVVKVGIGGRGGGPMNTDTTDGWAGYTGGTSSVTVQGNAFFAATGGAGGVRGQAAGTTSAGGAGGGSANPGPNAWYGTDGGSSFSGATSPDAEDAPGTSSNNNKRSCTGGGGGGGVSSTNVQRDGGAGGDWFANPTVTGDLGGAGSAGGSDADASDGQSRFEGWALPGTGGGGGGGSSGATAESNGGDGGRYGAGGGGGGAIQDTNDAEVGSGHGGEGGPGIVVITCY